MKKDLCTKRGLVFCTCMLLWTTTIGENERRHPPSAPALGALFDLTGGQAATTSTSSSFNISLNWPAPVPDTTLDQEYEIPPPPLTAITLVNSES